ncbi:hypothetical protein Q0Q93_03860, partial [Escherichia marmotae]
SMNEQVIVCAGGDFRNFSSFKCINLNSKREKSFCKIILSIEYAVMSDVASWGIYGTQRGLR